MTRRTQRIPPGAGPLDQRLRLWSGLILSFFAATHFLNHALGNVSLAAMQWGQDLRYELWHSRPGTVLLYGAFLLHIGLSLWKVARRRTFHMSGWEAAQLILGLLIPFLLIPHVIGTRGAEQMFHTYVDYRHALTVLWPGNAVNQSLLLLIVWTHAVIGLHYWLRLRSWYGRLLPYLTVVAIAVPLLALTGWMTAAEREMLLGTARHNFKPGEIEQIYALSFRARLVIYSLITIALAVPIVRHLGERFARGITVSYLGGRSFKVVPGPTLLEISRMKGVPHMSVCGGRGRCSTCRVHVLTGGENLDPPTPAERAVLKRVEAASGVRLACQIRPRTDLTVRPLIAADRPIPLSAMHDRFRWGVEQAIVVMFVDLRGFTRLTENRLAFDVVFILNRYIDGVVRSVRAKGGMIDKVMGDGVMVLYGVETDYTTAARQGLATVVAIVEELAVINRELESHLDHPLRIGIGLHGGPSILGRVGLDGRAGVASSLTALGDVVNVASRLETATKEEGAVALVSQAVFAAAGVPPEAVGRSLKLAVRGRAAALDAVAIDDVETLRAALAADPVPERTVTAA